jgi:hypothetical protein
MDQDRTDMRAGVVVTDRDRADMLVDVCLGELRARERPWLKVGTRILDVAKVRSVDLDAAIGPDRATRGVVVDLGGRSVVFEGEDAAALRRVFVAMAVDLANPQS